METRGAKKQELQEQISSMLALMEEMKTNQAEQAKHHEQQQTELLGELRMSTQRQADQLDRLRSMVHRWTRLLQTKPEWRNL